MIAKIEKNEISQKCADTAVSLFLRLLSSEEEEAAIKHVKHCKVCKKAVDSLRSAVRGIETSQ